MPWKFELEYSKGLMPRINKNYLNPSLGMGFFDHSYFFSTSLCKTEKWSFIFIRFYTYLFAAKELLQQGELFNLYGETNLTVFPPLYPLILAAIQKFCLSGDSAAVIINICAMSVCTFSSYIIIHKISNNIAVAGTFSLLVFIHPLMQGVFIYAYSEPVFIALLCMLLLIFSYIDQNNLYKISIFSGLLFGMAFLTRYGAIAIIPAVILGVFTINLVPMRKKLIACSLVLISCSLIIGPCLLRNYFVDGTLFGIRTESEDTILFALKRVALVTTEWLSPFRLKRYFKIGLGITFIIVFGVISSFFLKNSSAKNPVIISCLAFVVTHSALMVYTQVHTVVDPIDSRYLSPAIAPAIITLLGSIYILFQKINFPQNKYIIGIGLIFLLLHGWQSISQVKNTKIGSSKIALQPIDIPAEHFTVGSAIYSNNNTYLRFHQLFPNAKILPRQFIYRRSIRRDDWIPFIDSVKLTPVYMIWFKNGTTSYPSNEDLLGGPSSEVNIELISSLDQYYLYRVSLAQIK